MILIALFNPNTMKVYYNDKFDKAMEECLESIDEYTVLLNSPHFCKKVYYYLNPIGEVK